MAMLMSCQLTLFHSSLCIFSFDAFACLSCRITDRILPTSFDGVLPVFGLKSHNFATRSHSVPGDIAWVVDRNSRSAFSDADLLAACNLVSCKSFNAIYKNRMFVIY